MTNMWKVFPPAPQSISCPTCIRRVVVAGTGDRVFRSECKLAKCPINNDPQNRTDLWGTSISFELPSEISQHDRIARFAEWEKQGLEAIKADLSTGRSRSLGGPPAVRDLAWEWHSREANIQRASEQSELLSFKRGFWGVSIDSKKLGRRVGRFWRSWFK